MAKEEANIFYNYDLTTMTKDEANIFLESIEYFTKAKEIELGKCSKEQQGIYRQVFAFYSNLEPASHSMRDMEMKGFFSDLSVSEYEG